MERRGITAWWSGEAWHNLRDTHALVVDWRGVAFAEVEGRGITAYMCTCGTVE